MPRPPLIALYSPPKRVEAMEFLFNEMPDGMIAVTGCVDVPDTPSVRGVIIKAVLGESIVEGVLSFDEANKLRDALGQAVADATEAGKPSQAFEKLDVTMAYRLLAAFMERAQKFTKRD